MVPEKVPNPWQVGDCVCFAHSPAVYHVKSVHPDEPSVELEELPGFFASHLFVAAPLESIPDPAPGEWIAPFPNPAAKPAPEKLPYRTPELTGPFSLADISKLRAEIERLNELLGTYNADGLAKGAYLAYGRSTGNKNFRGEEMPKWEDLPEAIRTAWVAVAKFLFEKFA